MDTRLRTLERAAATGDPDAILAFARARRQAGTWVSPLSDGDWGGAFSNDGANVPELHDEVAVVVAARAGENETTPWVGLFRLFDGRYLGLQAWCDYTGWG